MYLTFLLDVEDFVSPEADDVAKTVANLLTEEGAPVTLPIVGERVRQWRARQRTDVIYSPIRVPRGDVHRFRGIPTYPLGRSPSFDTAPSASGTAC